MKLTVLFLMIINILLFIYFTVIHFISLFKVSIDSTFFLILYYIVLFISISFVILSYTKLQKDNKNKFNLFSIEYCPNLLKIVTIVIMLYSYIFYFIIWITEINIFPPIFMGNHFIVFSLLYILNNEKKLYEIKECSNFHMSCLSSKYCPNCGLKTKQITIPFFDVKKMYNTFFYYTKNITRNKKCRNGHTVFSSAKYCDQCGVKINNN